MTHYLYYILNCDTLLNLFKKWIFVDYSVIRRKITARVNLGTFGICRCQIVYSKTIDAEYMKDAKQTIIDNVNENAPKRSHILSYSRNERT